MNPEYVVLGGLFWKIMNKRVSLWYTHKQVNLKLKIAEKLTDKIFTVAKESFQLKSKKVHVMGHGIDVEKFKPNPATPIVPRGGAERRERCGRGGSILNIITIGRITPIKNCDVLIKTAKILKEKWDKNFHIQFIGSPTAGKDEQYFENLKKMVADMSLQNNIDFLGSIPNKDIKSYYCGADITVNLAPTGGVDKTVLESMASKTLVFASNSAFYDYFGQYSKDLIFKEKNPEDLAEKIMALEKFENKNEMKEFLFNKVKNTASLSKFIKNILTKLYN
jgi:glycosyltransferase involved in cell wall biosynthesis